MFIAWLAGAFGMLLMSDSGQPAAEAICTIFWFGGIFVVVTPSLGRPWRWVIALGTAFPVAACALTVALPYAVETVVRIFAVVAVLAIKAALVSHVRVQRAPRNPAPPVG
ncbi:MAG: hypothetical protein ACRD01_12185 [Terriglobales bacterium]